MLSLRFSFDDMANRSSQRSANRVTDEGLSRKHGLCLVPPEGVEMDDILLAIGDLIDVSNIRAASRMNHKIVVFVSQIRLADIVVQNGLTLGDDLFVPVSLMDTPAVSHSEQCSAFSR